MSGPWTAVPNVIAAVLAAWFLLRRIRSLAGTTLVAPCSWALIALAALSICEILLAVVGASDSTRGAAHARYCAAVATFTPLMALLGAKRPQNRAWQFIVLSLWVVLVLPELQAIATGHTRSLDLHAAWRWFLLLLIAVGAANGLPTRFWPSWLLAAVAQALLLSEQLPATIALAATTRVPLAMALLALAAGLWSCGAPRGRIGHTAFDRQWLDFRDTYGTLWALRVAERVNAAARMYGWSCELRWTGFVRASADSERIEPYSPPDDVRPALEQVWHSLLLRFVSPAWLAERATASDARIAPTSGRVN